MTISDKEFYELLGYFEKIRRGYFEKEPKRLWAKGNIYKNANINERFIAFRQGYELAKSIFEEVTP